MIFVFFIMLIPPLIVVLAVGRILRSLRSAFRTPLLILASLLLLTPSLGPATIVVVPAPFGYLLIPTAIDGSWTALASWVMSYPLWNAVAFPATAIVSYMIIRLVRPNHFLKADASGAAQIQR
jgi:hypothetical protein